MKKLIYTALFLPFIIFNAHANDQITPTKTLTPIYSQIITTSFPKGWKQAFEKENKGHYILEFVPKGDTLKAWNNMLTIQGFKGASSKISGIDFLKRLASSHKNVCGDKAIFEILDEHQISGFKAQNAIIGCSSIKSHPTINEKGKGEIAYYTSIEGKNDLYVIHKAIRTDEFNINDAPINKNNGKKFFSDITPIELHDR